MSEDGAEEQNKTQTKWILIDKFYINVSELFIFESINFLLRDVMFTHSLGCLLCLLACLLYLRNNLMVVGMWGLLYSCKVSMSDWDFPGWFDISLPYVSSSGLVEVSIFGYRLQWCMYTAHWSWATVYV